MKWISVKKKLPKPRQVVAILYVFRKTRRIYLAITHSYVGEYIYETLSPRGYWLIDREKVTHWCPIPKPPESRKEKK